MHNKGFISLLGLIVSILVTAGITFYLTTVTIHHLDIAPSQSPGPRVSSSPVACTQEAMRCPDGSYVGRIGPNCEFAECPKPIPSIAPHTGKITRTVGETESSFLIQRINSDSVEGLWHEAYPIPMGNGIPRTIRIGDNIGYGCEGISDKLTSIDFSGQRVTFMKITGQPPFGGCPICLASNTTIATPDGNINVKDVKVGMMVWSVNKKGEKVPSRIIQITRTPVPTTHHVVHLILADQRQVWVSPGHPIANGSGNVGELRTGDMYDGSKVVTTKHVSYWDNATYDLLPDSDTGYYWANGILLGSTLKQ